MANELRTSGEPGRVLYAIVYDPSQGKCWNPTLNTGAGGWQTYVAANHAQYPVALTEEGGAATSGDYVGNFPTNITVPGKYIPRMRQMDPGQVIGAAATTDAKLPNLEIAWDGTAELGQHILSPVIHRGTAQASTNFITSGSGVNAVYTPATITLAATAAAVDQIYTGRVLKIISGSGAGSVVAIIDYIGSTRIAKVAGSWYGAPADATSVYVILHDFTPIVDVFGRIKPRTVDQTIEADVVLSWLFARAGRQDVSSDGKTLNIFKADGTTPAGNVILASDIRGHRLSRTQL